MMRMAFRVHGRVQGVGFRYHVRELAGRLEIAGWVHNEFDGTVCGEAWGEPVPMEQFRLSLERGPSMSYVTRLDWTPLDEGQSPPLPFEVR
jgi:acylphosphatase